MLTYRIFERRNVARSLTVDAIQDLTTNNQLRYRIRVRDIYSQHYGFYLLDSDEFATLVSESTIALATLSGTLVGGNSDEQPNIDQSDSGSHGPKTGDR